MVLSPKNLNERIVEGSYNDLPPNFSKKVENPHFDSVEVLFKDIENRLIELILEYRDGVIFGCLAWLTSKPILHALAKCDNVQLIVQKEDFLRPDIEVLEVIFGNVNCNRSIRN